MFAARLVSAANGEAVTVADQVIFDISGAPPATATYTLGTDGTATDQDSMPLGTWIANPARASLYEVRATVTAGALSSGTTGAWLAMTSNRSWSVTIATVGINTAEFDLDIRLIGSGVTQDTGHITLVADST